ncbi:MAG: ABC transporter permease [Bacteroidales bacterium]|nr:ABC transporter permease [Bacteroidales bacterium]
MFKHYLKFSFRALRRQGGYVAINVLGLAIGMACALIIALFIMHEVSYDRHHEHRDRIYRVGLHGIFSGQEVKAAYTAAPMGAAMVADMPEVESFLRVNVWDETIIQRDDDFFIEPYFMEADSTFFDFFTVPLLRGNTATALTEPYSIVLSESAARRIFGDDDPINKSLRVGNMPNHYRVTGVMSDMPETSHLYADIIASFITNQRAGDENWLSNSFFTYIMLHPGAEAHAVVDRFEDLIVKYVGPQVRQILGITIEDFVSQGNTYNYFLQPLTSIHLDPSVDQFNQPTTDPKYLWIFGAIGLLILVIASINFMNLSTAQASRRAKEVGMKKVIGSTKGMLVGQFVTETVVLSALALLLAVLIAEITLPYFNDLLSLNLTLSYFSDWRVIPALILLVVTVGLFAGSYPAFYLSSFSPATVLKGKTGNGKQNTGLRKVLTVTQFAISIMLITGSLIMFKQLNYMISKDLGFDKENLLVIRQAQAIGDQVHSFKTEAQNIPGVMSVSASTAVPGRNNNNNGYIIRGREEESFLMQTNWVDYDFLETYRIELAEGRFFDPDMPTDRQAAVVNQSAVANYRMEDPFATRIVSPGDQETIMPVIGVVNNFHFESLQSSVGPYILRFKNENFNWGYISIRIEPGMTRQVLEATEQLWASFTSNDPMFYVFLDEDFRRFYQEERQNARLSVIFTLLAILIASLGLYGLTAFSLQQRVREIGIRKTFGASVSNIWYLVCKDVLVLVALASVLAWPLIYWVAGNWLQNYHYRISLQATDFLLGFGVAVAIALITISYRVINAASVNPAISMRYE